MDNQGNSNDQNTNMPGNTGTGAPAGTPPVTPAGGTDMPAPAAPATTPPATGGTDAPATTPPVTPAYQDPAATNESPTAPAGGTDQNQGGDNTGGQQAA